MMSQRAEEVGLRGGEGLNDVMGNALLWPNSASFTAVNSSTDFRWIVLKD